MKKLFQLVFLVFGAVFYFAQSTSEAQSGGWVSQPVPSSMQGVIMYDQADNCIAFTYTNSPVIYFFSVNNNQWIEADLGSVQNFNNVITRGHVVLAYTDKYLIGYSAILSEWDTLKYDGEPINSGASGYARGYGVSTHLAYFFTDAYMYVFDADLGMWQSQAFTMPGTFSLASSIFWAQEDYVAGIIYTEHDSFHKNLVYSKHTHSFNEYEQGGYISGTRPTWEMTHGYISEWYFSVQNTTKSKHLFLAYSAPNNSFIVDTLTVDGTIAVGCGGWGPYEENSVLAYTYDESVDNTNSLSYIAACDTRLGTWESTSYLYETVLGGGISNPTCGGQVAVAYRVNPVSQEYALFIYSGVTGSINTLNPDVLGTIQIVPGGTYVMVYEYDDNPNVWFYNVLTGGSFLIPSLGDGVTYYFGSDHYGSLSSIDDGVNTMTIIVYNREKDNWQTIQTPKRLYDGLEGNAGVAAFAVGEPDNQVYFYSPALDKIVKQDMPSDPRLHLREGMLAAVVASSEAYLFDPQLGTVTQRSNYDLSLEGLGDSICVFHEGNSTMHAYSALTQQWTSLENENPLFGPYSGGITSLVVEQNFNKLFAYNGYTDEWVPLIPESVHQFYKVGKRTAFVVRNDIVYAFNPLLGSTISIINQPEELTLCEFENGSFGIDVSGEGLSYQWQINDGSGFADLSDNSIYSGTQTDSLHITGALVSMDNFTYRCVIIDNLSTSITSAEAQLSVNTLPDVSINQNATILTAESTSAITLQWYQNDESIPGATDQVFNATQSGNYAVQVTDENNCVGFSESVEVRITNIEDMEEVESFSYYPSPMEYQLTIEYKLNQQAHVSLMVFDVNGKEMNHEVDEIQNPNNYHYTIDGQSWNNGVYVLLVRINNNYSPFKIVKGNVRQQ